MSSQAISLSGDTRMRSSHRLLSATLTVALLFLPTLVRADDDKPAPPEKAAEKTPEKAPLTEVTTQGTVDVGGQHIAYTAIAGTLTVGSTDEQDAQLGTDGKPQPGSQLALTEPKEPKDATPFCTNILCSLLQEGREGRGQARYLPL